MDLEEIAELIRITRLEAGVSQQELADRIGIPRTNLHRMETGKQPINTQGLDKIATALGKRLVIAFVSPS